MDAVTPTPNEDHVHKRALDILRGPYLLTSSHERRSDGARRPSARDTGEIRRESADEKRRRASAEGRSTE